MAQLRILREIIEDNWRLIGLGLIICLYSGQLAYGWWVRHQALGVGDAACIAKGHEEDWCDEATASSGQACLTLVLHTTGFRTPMPTLRGFDTDGYVACLELGPDGWPKAKRAAAAAAREPLKHEHSYP
jgi:hypothetical protein